MNYQYRIDEPTAALDPIAEQEIYEKFHTLVEGKTAVYISHRLSSCRFCDTILVIHEKAALLGYYSKRNPLEDVGT